MDICLDRGVPHLSCENKTHLLEMFRFSPHSEGWVVLYWKKDGDDVGECVEANEYGEDLLGALTKFAEMSKDVK